MPSPYREGKVAWNWVGKPDRLVFSSLCGECQLWKSAPEACFATARPESGLLERPSGFGDTDFLRPPQL